MATVRGLSYPLTLQNGGLQTSTDLSLILQAIYSVLETRPYERIMRPRYGTSDLAFVAHPSPAVIAERTRQALELQIAGVSFTTTGSIDENGAYTLTVDWAVNEIQQPPIRYALTL
ncbi:MAG TPA: hypothetical protein V6D06_04355 [Trichocoleus sp.]